MPPPSLADALVRALPPPVTLAPPGERQVASLWAGYGRVTEVTAVDATKTRHALVAKRVEPPRGGCGDVGHARKLASYVAEAAFYRELAPVLEAAVPGAPVARPLVVDDGLGDPAAPCLTLVLADLRPAYPVFPRGALSAAQLRTALAWLASFHAAFWGWGVRRGGRGAGGGGGGGGGGGSAEGAEGVDSTRATPSSPTPTAFLTPPPELSGREGTYWYLATRPDEFDAIDAREWGGLKEEAAGMAADLQALAAGPHGTLVHGDAKAANFAFTKDGTACAAFDFQYCGSGVGARDVAYLLCSASPRGALDGGGEDALLDHYYAALAAELGRRGPPPPGPPYTRATLRSHYDLAAADFFRFMAGWGSWGAADRCSETAAGVVAARRAARSSA